MFLLYVELKDGRKGYASLGDDPVDDVSQAHQYSWNEVMQELKAWPVEEVAGKIVQLKVILV